jgi:DNA-binding PadR family transcriptional regulator
MSIRLGLLALLQESPAYGYQLRSDFETRTGATWPLNIGQVYTTLARLERDGLVEIIDSGEGDGGQATTTYAITDAGRAEVSAWFLSPVAREDRPRDELAIKLALAVTTPGVDVHAVVQSQRTDTLRTLQELTRLKAQATDDDLAWLLVLDSLIFQAEAEVRWLDHCESRLVRHAKPTPTPAPTPAPRTGLRRMGARR